MERITKYGQRKHLQTYKTLSEEYFIAAPTNIHTDPSGKDSDSKVRRRSYSAWEMAVVLGTGTILAKSRENDIFEGSVELRTWRGIE